MSNTFNPFSLEGKNILVTGASSGIGRQCAIDCSKMGARVVLVARNEERLQETLTQMEGEGHRIYAYDLGNLDGIGNKVNEMVAECGKFDGFVHSAGVEMTKPMKLLTAQDYEHVLRVNTMSGLEMAKHLTGIKCFNKMGGVIFVSSITAVIARKGVAAYAASKGALVSAARVMAVELAKRDIRVNTISPGTILTPLMENYLSTLSEEAYEKRISGFPLGLGKPEDTSCAVIYLLSDASRWVTGQNLIIDGGYTIQ